MPNAEGRLSQTAREYYGGPFINSEGEFLHKAGTCICGRGDDHFVDPCGAGTLEHSSKVVRGEGIISVAGIPCNLGRGV